MILQSEKSRQQKVARMIRVNQAGEYGAARIYQGQLDYMKPGPTRDLVEHMKAQEQVHLDTFNDLMVSRRVRPTLLSPLWHGAGYALGALSACLGDKAAMACTVAVEEVIQEHYEAQLTILAQDSQEQALASTIAQFQQEEQEHHDIGVMSGAADMVGFKVATALIKNVSRLAIWLSTRL